MPGILEGKVAVVTGAGSGIGRACAEQFAREGARLVVGDIDERSNAETLALVHGAGGRGIAVRCDTSKAEDGEALVAAAVRTYGALHVAVNNAGIGGPQAYTADYPLDGWDNVIAVNLSGVFYGMKYQIPAMIHSGGGSIVNISSILGAVAFRGAPAYVAAKHGVLGLTQNAAVEYAAHKVRVNSVGPAFIKTPLLNTLSPEITQRLVGMHPIGRLGEPSEVAELVTWLSSDKASFVTGSYYPVDGGFLAQ
jgi:NAD(P)-dependent dehydrogenase (short-subunit alcohol dehydrogenase family)